MYRASFAFLLAFALSPLACSGGAGSSLTDTCTPGTNQSCICPSGAPSLQICSGIGTFLPCLCEAPDAGGSDAHVTPRPDAAMFHADGDVDCSCDDPPGPVCLDANTLQVETLPGSCASGACVYTSQTVACADGCVNGACGGSDPCAGVTCDSPPAPTCTDASDLETFASTGSCSGGVCTYASSTSGCPDGCSDGACAGDPCGGVVCDEPPSAVCVDDETLETYDSTGTCSGGTCSYGATDTTCDSGCSDGECEDDPCEGVTCDTPPANFCETQTLAEIYTGDGTCSDGTCSYQATATTCTTTVANATPLCDDGACTFACDTGYTASGSACVASAAWTLETSGTTATLEGVFGFGGTDVYAVGFDGISPNNVILHSSGGGAWTMQTPAPAGYALERIWGASATDIYAASQEGTVVSTGDGTWTVVSPAVAPIDIWGSGPDDVYAVGGGTIDHWNGSGAWTAESGCTSTDLLAVWGASSTSVYVVGTNGIACFSSGGGTWTPQTMGTTTQFYGLWGSSATDVYAVGEGGAIYHTTGNGTWAAETSGTSQMLWSIWGGGPGDIYAVGVGGTILHSAGGGVWTAETSGTTQTLFGVWGGGGADVYAVGGAGTIVHKS